MTSPDSNVILDVSQLGELVERVADDLQAGSTAEARTALTPLRSADLAAVLAELPESLLPGALELLDNHALAEALGMLNSTDAGVVFQAINLERRASVLEHADPEDAADMLHTVDFNEASHTLVRMSNSEAIGELLVHRDEDAGGLMSPDFITLRNYWTARHALRVLRDGEPRPEALRQLYVIDAQDQLVGRLELSTIVFAKPGSTMSDIMNPDVISVSATDDQEEAVRVMERYQLVSVPVTNASNRLEGVIGVSDLVNVAEQEATEDMLRIIGVTGQITSQRKFTESVRNRLPWLMLNLATVLVAGFALSWFEPTLDSLAVLAVFLPVVMGQAGIAGVQTLTIIVRMLALGDRPFSVPRMLIDELILGIAQGLFVGAVLGAIVYFWQRDGALTILVTVSMVLNLAVAALAGVIVPSVLRIVKVDPATASAVFVTTATDVCGIILYLGLATVFLTTLVN